MVRLTRLNGADIVVNAEQIESVEETPDTVLTFVNGQKISVRETVDEVIEKVVAYQQEVRRAPGRLTGSVEPNGAATQETERNEKN